MRNLAAVLVVTSLLTACGSAQLKDASAIRSADQLPIKLQDERPADDKQTSKGSALLTACDYATYKYGDDKISPSAATYLANYINSHFQPSGGASDVIVLHHLAVYYNAQAQLRGDSSPGALASAIVQGVSCYPPISAPGAVDYKNEDPNGSPAMLVYIDADFRGHHYVTRYFEAIKHLTQFQVMFPVLDHAFDQAFAKAS
jgi:hypothetical protein